MCVTYYYDLTLNDGRTLRFSTTSNKATAEDLTAFFRNAVEGAEEAGIGFLLVPDWITVTEL